MQNYRYWILWRVPQVRFLDFQKVKDAERSKAKELFGTKDEPSELAQSIMKTRSTRGFGAGMPGVNGAGKGGKMKTTEAEKKRFQVLIQNAKTLAEVQKLEKMFNEGRLPTGVMDGESMEET